MTAPDIRFLPGLAAGWARTGGQAVEDWVTVGWLLAVEGRAFIEDLHGGTEQPELQFGVALRLLELLAEVDARLAAARPVDTVHGLAVALEFGLREVATMAPADVAETFGVSSGLRPEVGCTEAIDTFWDALLDAFPGHVPDPLLPSGQGEMIRALRNWSKAATAVGRDAGFLEPFLKDA